MWSGNNLGRHVRGSDPTRRAGPCDRRITGCVSWGRRRIPEPTVIIEGLFSSSLSQDRIVSRNRRFLGSLAPMSGLWAAESKVARVGPSTPESIDPRWLRPIRPKRATTPLAASGDPQAPGLSFGTARALIAEYAGVPPAEIGPEQVVEVLQAEGLAFSGCDQRRDALPANDFAGPAGSFWIPPTGEPVRPSKTSTSVACRPRDAATISGPPSLFTSRAESESPR
jgi:hypothetical protein